MQDELRVDDLKNNWDLIKEKMKTDYDISSVAFNTWIQPLEIYNVSKDQVIILVTNWNTAAPWLPTGKRPAPCWPPSP